MLKFFIASAIDVLAVPFGAYITFNLSRAFAPFKDKSKKDLYHLLLAIKEFYKNEF